MTVYHSVEEVNKLRDYLIKSNIPEAVTKVILNEEFIRDTDIAYLKYTSLFSDAFSFTKKGIIDKLNIAGFLYYQSLIGMDELFDSEEVKQSSNKLIFISICQEEAIKILSSIFPIDSFFWRKWKTRRREFMNSLQLNKILLSKSKVSFKEFKTLANDKSAFGKVAIDAIYTLSLSEKRLLRGKILDCRYKDLIKAHGLFSVGLQLLDDISDFKEDISNNQFNWAVYAVAQSQEIKQKHLNTYSEKLHKTLYLSGVVEQLYSKAIKSFRFAHKLAHQSNAIVFSSTIKKKENLTLFEYDQMKGYVDLVKRRSELHVETRLKKNGATVFYNNRDIDWCIKYLIAQLKSGFGELKHLMYLSAFEGFKGKSIIHEGDIFQRAYIGDILARANISLKSRLIEGAVQKEINYLIGKEIKSGLKGWRYFPSVKEISPDIDDLGQIIQFLHNGSRSDLVAKHCNKLIQFVLSNNYDSTTGGIRTWILPTSNLNKLQQVQYKFNSTKWGNGPDIEVMANFLYSILLIDRDYETRKLSKSVTYILAAQSEEGYWSSRWYYGNYYGTFVVVRLLNLVVKNAVSKRALKKAFQYIKNSQNDDGGWGMDGQSDPLNTSLSLLSLLLMKPYITNTVVIERSITYLLRSLEKWPNECFSVPFIYPRVNEPYSSKTMTIGIIFDALMKYESGR